MTVANRMTAESRRLVLQILALAVSTERAEADVFVDWAPHVNLLSVRIFHGGEVHGKVPDSINCFTNTASAEHDLRTIRGAVIRAKGGQINTDEILRLSGTRLAQHILDMADDDYLCGHPEWVEIVKEARGESRAEHRGTFEAAVAEFELELARGPTGDYIDSRAATMWKLWRKAVGNLTIEGGVA